MYGNLENRAHLALAAPAYGFIGGGPHGGIGPDLHYPALNSAGCMRQRCHDTQFNTHDWTLYGSQRYQGISGN